MGRISGVGEYGARHLVTTIFVQTLQHKNFDEIVHVYLVLEQIYQTDF